MILKEMEKDEKKIEKLTTKFYRICGFLIYYEKKLIDNEDKNPKKDKKIYKINLKNELNDIKIYGNINKTEANKLNNYNDTNKNNEANVINQNNEKQIIVEGKENVVNDGIKDLNANENNSEINDDIQINYKDIICSIIIPCYKDCISEDKNSKYCCASCKLGWRKFYYNSVFSEYNDFRKIFDCCTCCYCEECCGCCPLIQECCCKCCEKLELKENYEEEEIFCYVYQTQRKCSWFCDLLFKNHIHTLVIFNILYEIQIIGFEKKLNENLEMKVIKDNLITLSVYLIFFFVLIFLFSIPCLMSFREKDLNFFIGYSFFFNVINILFSGFSAFGKNKLKSRTDNWFNLLSISCTKFYNFLLLEKLVDFLDDENIDILSNSVIITSVFFIYDVLIFLITDILEISSEHLILFQFIIGFVILAFSTYIKNN